MNLILQGQVLKTFNREKKKTNIAIMLSGYDTVKLIFRKEDRQIVDAEGTGEVITVPVEVNIYNNKAYFMKVYES